MGAPGLDGAPRHPGFDSTSGEVVQTTAFVIDTRIQARAPGPVLPAGIGEERGGEGADARRCNRIRGSGCRVRCVDAMTSLWFRSRPSCTGCRGDEGGFAKGERLGDVAHPRQGLATADNDRFLRQWFEVSANRTGFGMSSRGEAKGLWKSGFRTTRAILQKVGKSVCHQLGR